MTTTSTLTNGQAAQLNAERVSGREIYSAVRCQHRYYDEIDNILTVAATANYLDSLDKDNLPSPENAAHGLLQKTVETFREFNEKLDENKEPLDMPEELTPYQAAKLMMTFYHIRLVVDVSRYKGYKSGSQNPDRYQVMLYVADESIYCDLRGEGDIGAYTTGFYRLVERFSPYLIEGSQLAFGRFEDEVEFWLRIFAPKAGFSYFQGFLPLENGVLNCRTKEFLPFSPEYVFDTFTYIAFYEEGEDGPVILLEGDAKQSVDDWIKTVASYTRCEELRRILSECV